MLVAIINIEEQYWGKNYYNLNCKYSKAFLVIKYEDRAISRLNTVALFSFLLNLSDILIVDFKIGYKLHFIYVAFKNKFEFSNI